MPPSRHNLARQTGRAPSAGYKLSGKVVVLPQFERYCHGFRLRQGLPDHVKTWQASAWLGHADGSENISDTVLYRCVRFAQSFPILATWPKLDPILFGLSQFLPRGKNYDGVSVV